MYLSLYICSFFHCQKFNKFAKPEIVTVGEPCALQWSLHNQTNVELSDLHMKIIYQNVGIVKCY